MIVAKFGGSSLADAAQFAKVKDILFADVRRSFVVPSAPGKRDSTDEKVTDMLYKCQSLASQQQDFMPLWVKIENRYLELKDRLGLKVDIQSELDAVRERIPTANADYAASRGEYLNGKLLADYLGWDFLDPAESIFFDQQGVFDAELTDRILSEKLKQCRNAVVPGFYGSMPGGVIKTFSRGGSDITGAIVARAARAEVYENWTDTPGFLMTDPRVVKNPKPINSITYRELRELSYMGATVFHEDAIFPVRQAGIPIHIKNTNAPEDAGTRIMRVTSEAEAEARGVITGIAGKKGFTVIAIEKAMMNAELGFGRRILGALEKYGVSFEHLPTGIDTMSVVVSDVNIGERMDAVLQAIRRDCQPDSIHVETGLALIATVGRGMVKFPGTAAKLFDALAAAGINVRMIDQGSSEINIIVGVDNADFEKAVQAIYERFVG